jgi:hypothetical protein
MNALSMMNTLASGASAPAGAGSGSTKDETKLKPYLRLCNVIDEKRGEIQSALINRFNEVFLKEAPVVKNPTELYDKIKNTTISVVASRHMDSLFRIDKNLHIMAFKLAKDAYKANKPTPKDNIFSAKDFADYNTRLNAALDVLLRPTEGGSRKRKSNVLKQTGGSDNLDEIFNKLYSNNAFQETIDKMVTRKIEKIIESPEVEKQLLTIIKPQFDKTNEVIIAQFDKLLHNLNNDKVMNLLMIKALGDGYVQQYFHNPGGKTLEQYIDDSILSEEKLAAKQLISGGRRKTKRRQPNKRRKRSSTKNIA